MKKVCTLRILSNLILHEGCSCRYETSDCILSTFDLFIDIDPEEI